MRGKLCTRSSGALGVFSTCEHERSLRAARQRITVSIGETCIFTTVLSLVSCRLTSTRVARRADLSLSRHTCPAGLSRASAEASVTTELRSTSGVHPRAPARKSSSQIGACEGHACKRIRHGLASHSPWFWCLCSRYRSGKHNAFVGGNASFVREVTLSAPCGCRVASKLVCQPLHSDTGQFGRPGLRTSRLRLTSLLPRRVISTSTIMRT